MEDNIYELRLQATSIRMLHRAVTFALDKWPGGEPMEQEHYKYLQEGLQRILLEEAFMSDAWRLLMERGVGTSE